MFRVASKRDAPGPPVKQATYAIEHNALCTHLFSCRKFCLLARHKVRTTRSKLLGAHPTQNPSGREPIKTSVY